MFQFVESFFHFDIDEKSPFDEFCLKSWLCEKEIESIFFEFRPKSHKVVKKGILPWNIRTLTF